MTSDFYKRPLFLFLVLYALVISFFVSVPKPKTQDISSFINYAPKEITLKITSYPIVKKDRLLFYADILSAEKTPQKGRSYVYCKECSGLMRGEEITLKGIIEPVFYADNYGSFNWRTYLARRNIFTAVRTENKNIISVKPASKIWRILNSMRNSMLSVFQDNLSPQAALVLGGITLGEKGSLDKGLYAAFQDSGAIHLLVASGGNVGFITLIVYLLCSLFFTGRYFPAFAALSAALLYTLIAGADAPLIRAYIMALCSTLGFLLGRKSGILQGFVIAALIILIFNPQSIFDTGFQMSFLAVLFIVWFTCNFSFLSKWPPVAAWAGGIFLVSLSAQLALLPIFTNCFHRVSFAAVLSNIILVPLSGALMGGGFLMWAASFLPFDILFKSIVFVMEKLLYLFNFFVEAFAATPLAGIEVHAWSYWYVAAYYCLLFVVFNFPVFKNKKYFVSIVLSITAVLFLCGVFIKPDFTRLLESRYSKALFVRQKNEIKLIGGGIDAQTAKTAVLQAGTKQIDCLFINSVYKSSAYVLKDLQGIKIKNIYLPDAELSEGTKELLNNIPAQIHTVQTGKQYCGVDIQIPWYGQYNISEPKKEYKSLSLAHGEYSFSADMKSYKKDGELFLYN